MKIFCNICYFIVAIVAIISVVEGHDIPAIIALLLCILCRIAIIEAHVEEIKKTLSESKITTKKVKVDKSNER